MLLLPERRAREWRRAVQQWSDKRIRRPSGQKTHTLRATGQQTSLRATFLFLGEEGSSRAWGEMGFGGSSEGSSRYRQEGERPLERAGEMEQRLDICNGVELIVGRGSVVLVLDCPLTL